MKTTKKHVSKLLLIQNTKDIRRVLLLWWSDAYLLLEIMQESKITSLKKIPVQKYFAEMQDLKDASQNKHILIAAKIISIDIKKHLKFYFSIFIKCRT